MSFLLSCAIQFDEYAAYIFAFEIIEIDNDKIYLANLFQGSQNSAWFMSILFKKNSDGLIISTENGTTDEMDWINCLVKNISFAA